MNQSTLGSSSTILQPLSEARGLKICSNGQQIWFVNRSSKIFDLLPCTSVNDREWLNCSPRCFDSNHNLPEFLYSVAIFPVNLDDFSWTPPLTLRILMSTDTPLCSTARSAIFLVNFRSYIRKHLYICLSLIYSPSYHVQRFARLTCSIYRITVLLNIFPVSIGDQPIDIIAKSFKPLPMRTGAVIGKRK